MFHRVKPEAEQEKERAEAAPAPAARNAETRPEKSNAGSAAPARPDKKERDNETAASPPSTSQEGKTRTMNAQSAAGANESKTSDQAAAPSRPAENPAYSARPAASVAGAGYTGAVSYAAGPSYGTGSGHGASQNRSTGGSESLLTIGRGITLSGEIEACEHIVVQGTVEAALKGARILEVEQGGTFYGTVEIEEATIAGRFEGDITVRGRLSIRETGYITGSIAYGQLDVEAGATIEGRLTPVKARQAEAASETLKAPQAEKAKEGKSAKSQAQPAAPANNDGELFASKSAAE